MEIRRVKMLLIPTKEQEQKFWDSIYYSRKAYNLGLQWSIESYELTGENYSAYDLCSLLTEYKESNPELYSIDSCTLTQPLLNLGKAFKSFFKKTGKYPRFKSYKTARKSFYTRGNRLLLADNKIKLSSLGIIKSKPCHWLLDFLTDSLERYRVYNPYVIYDNKYWYLTFGIEVEVTEDELTEEVVGLDLGVLKTITTSENISYDNINKTRTVFNLQRRKKRVQRKLNRKYEKNKTFKKSNNTRKLEQKIRLIDRRLHNIRDSYNHKITNDIIEKLPKAIVIEDLKVKNMLRNKYLSRSIQEQSFYRLRQLLIEKAKNHFIEVIVAPWNYPSSKTCNHCKERKSNLALATRTFVCNHCGFTTDRDYNASLNLRDYYYNRNNK